MQRIHGRSAEWEIYSGMLARAPLVARADGRSFKKVLEECKKPYDMDFAKSMASAAGSFFVLSGLKPALAFTFSDEISLVFLEAPFGGRVEKIDSLVAGLLSAALSLDLKKPVSMDCRTIPICKSEICEYLAERQDEAWRNHVFSYGFYMLRQEGHGPNQAMEMLRGLSEPEIHEIVFKKGINLARTDAWERRGVMVYRKDGLISNWDLPLFRAPEGRELIRQITDSCSG